MPMKFESRTIAGLFTLSIVIILGVWVYWDHSQKNVHYSQKLNLTNNKIVNNFNLNSLKKNQVKFTNDQYAGYLLEYTGEGIIKNLSDKTLSDYSLKTKYQATTIDGKAFILGDNYDAFQKDGFGGMILNNEKAPWNPGEEKKFSISNSFFHKDIAYPVAKMKVQYFFNGIDPLKNQLEEKIGEFDITEEWLKAREIYLVKYKKNGGSERKIKLLYE
jgi:hypothetical protein